ncbi:calcium-translocating P-type ATPase, PMCA-type [Chlorobaculum parvum NCIB 8327]|uniref:Calcium-translocating P-type ATPase, PMCA-type n=1 Tax=Chlorobaculum parvum (strain DSM 263 / NCIMB 8327) TaxID=517417 RepID=B3QN42_CHLP8|nr:cation-translocating P-type ATPase [Chlorobaculum parvum]ACF11345.1 calcium-translocating P-type ATPase, PMCA-type [Chlorobaculum parvum NCIB 8327]
MPEAAHSISVEAVLKQFNTSPRGLSEEEASRKLEQYGFNQLDTAPPVSPWKLLVQQFANVLIITLLVATVLSAFLGHGIEAIAIAVIVLFAVLLGFIQEYRAEKSIEALRRMAAPASRVIRDGVEKLIPSQEVVPGDIVVLATGDRIPADARLVEAVNLRTDEAALTGESLPAEKEASAMLSPQTSVGDRRNMVFSGTSVVYGRGLAVVTATGMQTEFGRIAGMLSQVKVEKTPLQKNLDKVGASLARAALVIVALIVALGIFRGQPFIEILIFGIALAVAVVPEALPAVVTISLALGVQRMVKRNALMRRLPAVETLGSTTVICSDKTGTLTRDEMTVRRLYAGAISATVSGSGYKPEGAITSEIGDGSLAHPFNALLEAGVLCNDSHLEESEKGEWGITGDPTEAALIVAARKAGLDEAALQQRYPRIDEEPFDSATKRMVTVHRFGGSTFAVVKGAPEVILPSCSDYLDASGELKPFDSTVREEAVRQADSMGQEALRVLAVARKENASISDFSDGLTFLGLFGMIDPPRSEAAEAVERCIAAGIRPVMITGDHPVTAQAVARELGILRNDKVVTGAELEAMDDEALSQAAGSVAVFARVSPEHKLRLVQALQQRGEVVAMTGDGVNDAPALKRADIGISMGIAGTDVSREASAMTLLDDNFATIVSAIEEGRGIYDNIKKYLTYLLSSNIGELGLMAGATLFGLPLPLTAVQILYVNLATDGLPALALAVDPADHDIMRRPPNDQKRGIFTRTVMALMLAGGIWSTAVNLLLFQWARHSGRSLDEAMTMTFVSLVLIQFFKAYNFRSEREHVFTNLFSNRWLNLAIVWELAVLFAIIYVPALAAPFGTFMMPFSDWLIVLGGALTVVPVIELVKWFIRKGWIGS